MTHAVGQVLAEDQRIAGDLHHLPIEYRVLLTQVVLLLGSVLHHRDHSLLCFYNAFQNYLVDDQTTRASGAHRRHGFVLLQPDRTHEWITPPCCLDWSFLS